MKNWSIKWIFTNSNSCPTRQIERALPMEDLRNWRWNYRCVRTNCLCCPSRCPPSSDSQIDCWYCSRPSIREYSRTNMRGDSCWWQHGCYDSMARICDNLTVAMVASAVAAAVVAVERCAERFAPNSACIRSFQREPLSLGKQQCLAKMSSASIRFADDHRNRIECRHCDRLIAASRTSTHSTAVTNG